MKKKKVFMIAWNVDGGSETVRRSLEKGLKKRGVDVDTLYHHLDSNPRLVTSDGYDKTFQDTTSFFNDPNQKKELKKYFAVHTHTPTLKGKELRDLKKRTGSPLVSTPHSLMFVEALSGSEYLNWLKNLPIAERLDALENLKKENYDGNQSNTFRESDGITLMTQQYLRDFEFFYPEYTTKCVIIPHGSDFHELYKDRIIDEKASEFKKRMGNNNIVSFSGRIIPQKGVRELARSFNQIKSFSPNTKLVYAGEAPENECKEAILSAIKPEYREDVIFTGWLKKEEIAGIYKASDVLVMPSYTETFCLSALEGMMMGTPVVITEVDGPKEAFIDKWLAYGIKPGDSDGITKWVKYITKDNPTQAKRNADMVRIKATNLYSLDRMADSTLGLYERLARGYE